MKSLKNFIKSFVYAGNGLQLAVQQRNFRLHIVSFLILIAMCLFFDIKTWEFIVLLICAAGVLSLEIVNTSIEKTVDYISTERNEQAKAIKDLAAAAVLVFSLFSLLIAIWIFLPYLWAL